MATMASRLPQFFLPPTPRMLASLYLETERNHIRISLSVAEKFNSLLAARAADCA
jgi:hypothetical protein